MTSVSSTAIHHPAQSRRPVSLPYNPLLFRNDFLEALLPSQSPSLEKSDDQKQDNVPFMTALRDVSNRTLTQNDAAAWQSTGDSNLDAFTGLSQATSEQDFAPLLDASWNQNPLTTIKIIWNLRSIHQGKAAREPFYRAFAWLYQSHPRSAITNLEQLVLPVIEKPSRKKEKEEVPEDAKGQKTSDSHGLSHGYFKDLLNLLALASVNQLHPTAKFTALHAPRTESEKPTTKRKKYGKRTTNKTSKASSRGQVDAEARIKLSQQRDKELSDAAAATRHEKESTIHVALVHKLESDKPFQALFIAVTRIFSKYLLSDLKAIRAAGQQDVPGSTSSPRVSLAGKWAPTVNGSHDRATNMCTAIAIMLCHEDQGESLHMQLPLTGQGNEHDRDRMSSQEFAHSVRTLYSQCVTTPLRTVIKIPERHMSANEWNQILYNRVPSICMSKSKQLFFKHDKDRFSKYLHDVATGKQKISGATLLPHQLLFEVVKLGRQPRGQDLKANAEQLENEMNVKVIEEQWRTLVKSIKEAGVLDNAMALCDVSGSMGFLGSRVNSPIHPAVALSILLSQVASPPWQNSFITFSAQPEIVTLDPDAGLADTATTMVGTHWEMNTDFNAVFTQLILPLAIKHNLKKEDMIKRLFVFSDMEFDNSRGSSSYGDNHNALKPWETEHAIIKKEFADAGYELPEIVYWNLQGRGPHATTKDEEGVAMVSGFSPGMLKVFLQSGSSGEEVEETWEVVGEDGQTKTVTEKKKLDPIETMHRALNQECYQGLKVLDWSYPDLSGVAR